MTILPKKKTAKEKGNVASGQEKEAINSDSEHESLPGAAGGQSPTPERNDEPHGYHHYPPPHPPSSEFFQRHFSSSGESSPELPVLSKGSYRGGASAQSRVKPSSSPCNGSPYSGYNSAEEYEGQRKVYSDLEKERLFEESLKQERGFIIKRMRPDGACLFRAVADQVYGDQEMHSVVRNHCMDYMLKNGDYFSQFVTEDFEHYINRKRSDRCYGNYLEMQAIAEMYNRSIEVFQYSIEPINTFFGIYKTDNPPLRLSYHRGVHYNSVVDPNKATIGVGLGLAGYKPGLADKNLMSKALKESEQSLIEKTMLEDKLRTSDWDATYEAIEQAVARESYLMWLKEQEQRTGGSMGGGPSRVANQSSSNSWHCLPSPVPPISSVCLPPSAPPTISSSCMMTQTTVKSSASNTTWTTPTPKPPLRARSRSRSSSRGNSPSIQSPQLGRSPSRGQSSPHPSPVRSGRISPRTSSRSSSRAGSAKNSPHTSPLGSPRLNRSRHPSPLIVNQPSSNSGSPLGSPLLKRSSPPLYPPPLTSDEGGDGGGTNSPRHTNPQLSSDSRRLFEVALAPQTTSSLPPLDFESGQVLSQMPYEYSSFFDLPPSALGLSEWEDDRELAAVLAASQQEYIDSFKHNSSSQGAESL